MLKKYNQYILPLSFLVAGGAFIGSMMLSSLYQLAPCELCWYQRIAMFPIPILIGAALLRRDNKVYWYVLPLSVTGMLISLFQTLLQWGIVGESVLSCGGLVSCAEKQVELLGFITIPLGSFLVFSTITALMFAQMKHGGKITSDFKQQVELLARLTAALLVALLIFIVAKRLYG